MGKLKTLLLALSICIHVRAEPLADSLEVLSDSLTALAGFLPKAGPRVREFGVYKEFDYAPPAPGVAQPKLKIGLDVASGDLIVEGPELDASKNPSFKAAAAGVKQVFKYPVDAATKMKWNAAGQVADEGPRAVFVLYPKPAPGSPLPLIIPLGLELLEKFQKLRDDKIDFDVRKDWLESSAPEAAEGRPDFLIEKEFEYANPLKGGKVPTIAFGIDNKTRDLVVYGPKLQGVPSSKDFVKNTPAGQRFMYPVNLVDDRVNFEVNEKGELQEGAKLSRSTYVLLPESLMNSALLDSGAIEATLYDALMMEKRGAGALDVNKWWMKYEIPKGAEDAGVSPFSFSKNFGYVLSPLAGGLHFLKVGLAKNSGDLVVAGPELINAQPKDFVKGKRLMFPIAKTRVKWQGNKVSDEGKKAIFTLMTAKERAGAVGPEEALIKKFYDAVVKESADKVDLGMNNFWIQSRWSHKPFSEKPSDPMPVFTGKEYNIEYADSVFADVGQKVELLLGIAGDSLVVYGPKLDVLNPLPNDFIDPSGIKFPVPKASGIRILDGKIEDQGPLATFALGKVAELKVPKKINALSKLESLFSAVNSKKPDAFVQSKWAKVRQEELASNDED